MYTASCTNINRCRLRRMDFLIVPDNMYKTYATALNTHPELAKPTHVVSGFSGHPCPEIADRERNIKKTSFNFAMTVDDIVPFATLYNYNIDKQLNKCLNVHIKAKRKDTHHD